MHPALVICAKDLRQRLRDRTAIGVGFVAPLVLSGLMGLSLSRMDGGLRVRLAVAGLDGSPESHALLEHVSRPWVAQVAELEQVESAEAVWAALAAETADAGLVLLEGGGEIEVVAVPRASLASRLARGLAQAFVSPETAGSRPVLLPRSPGGRLRAVEFFGTSMAVLFLTFTVLAGSRALQTEAETGTLARLAAAPIRPVSILVGKFSALVLLGLSQMTVMIAATTLLFGVRWGNPLPVAALAATSVLMAVGLASFFVAAAGAQRGNMLATVAIFLLAVLGGQFLPPAGLPDGFDVLNRLTPNGQAHRGFTDLIAAGARGGLSTVREPLLVTAGVGLAGIAFAVARARQSLRRSLG